MAIARLCWQHFSRGNGWHNPTSRLVLGIRRARADDNRTWFGKSPYKLGGDGTCGMYTDASIYELLHIFSTHALLPQEGPWRSAFSFGLVDVHKV